MLIIVVITIQLIYKLTFDIWFSRKKLRGIHSKVAWYNSNLDVVYNKFVLDQHTNSA